MTQHSNRLAAIDSQLRAQLAKIVENQNILEEEQQIHHQQQHQFTIDMGNFSSQLPTITETLERQQQQLLKYFRRQNKFNNKTNTEIENLRKTQASQENMISTLQSIVLLLQLTTPPTPQSHQRTRKKDALKAQTSPTTMTPPTWNQLDNQTNSIKCTPSQQCEICRWSK
jgi:chromosome segregation ATPase